MEEGRASPDPLAIRDCTVTALATGEEAWTLRELRDRLRRIPAGSLYYHFQGRLLRPVFEVREFNNDLADWTAFSLGDRVLAERLALVDTADFSDLEELREELTELCEERVVEVGRNGTLGAERPFHFIEGKLVVFATYRKVESPYELADLCPHLSRGSVYYHLVDARRRDPQGRDDFQRWLGAWGDRHVDLMDELARIDISFSTLRSIRSRLTELFESLAGEEG